MMRIVGVFFLFAISPAVVFAAGSQTFNASGTFTVPSSYGTIIVQVWGGGGGGVGLTSLGTSGGTSIFGSLASLGSSPPTANGGSRGVTFSGGAGGTAINGTTNTTGGAGTLYTGAVGGSGGASPNGGTGGAGVFSGLAGAGTVPGGGGGSSGTHPSAQPGGAGAGGYSSKTYSAGTFASGLGIPVTVGAGGTGGISEGNLYRGGAGGAGRVVVTWTDPVAACSVTADVNPLGYGNSTTLRWTSSNATTMYINSVGYVTPNVAGSATVGPLATTNYDGTAVGGSTVNCAFTLTVSAPATCTFNGGSVAHGASVTGYQTATVPFGSSCASQTRTCSNGSLSGTYTFASCNVGPQCAVSVSPTSVTQGNSATLTWSSSNATSCTGDNFSTAGATAGSVSVSPSQSTTYTATCTGAGGSAQCTGTGSGGMGTVLTLSCTPAYSCTGAGSQTITYTDAACTVTNSSTCVLPQFCSAGSSSCLIAAVAGTFSSSPRLVPSGKTAQITWSVSNAVSCTVSGNGNTWTGTANTQTSNVITELTTYTLVCDDADADGVQDDFSRSITLYRVPSWVER